MPRERLVFSCARDDTPRRSESIDAGRACCWRSSKRTSSAIHHHILGVALLPVAVGT
jgi:hypothetical protein